MLRVCRAKMRSAMTREEAKQHIAEIRRERFWLDDLARRPSENPLLGMLRRTLSQIATGIFEHAHHYVFELTQNADDNKYPTGAECFLKFVLLDDDPTRTPGSQGCLCVLNDEAGFGRAHVESLCDIGNSTKHNREGYIGEKGIGFKSVFLISNRPHIISNGYSFHFRRDDCDAGLGYIVPHLNERTPTVAEGVSTTILLPLRSTSGVDVAKQLADIEAECILFLRRLRRIELVSAKHGLNRVVQCSEAHGFVNLDAGGTQSTYFVHRTEHSCAHIREPLRDGVSSTWVTVALPLTTSEVTNGRVFAFLPTEARTGFPFLINADFLLPASRERIFDTPAWNKELVKFAGATFIEAFDKLRINAEHRTSIYRFIPTKADLLQEASLFEPLLEDVIGSLKKSMCILTDSGEYALPGETYFAGTLSRRLLAGFPPKLANFKLVHSELESHRNRLEPLGVRALTITQCIDICADSDWLQNRTTEWWETLFELLAQLNVTAEAVASFPMLRCRDGICRCSTDGVFLLGEGQPTPASIPKEWPFAHIFDSELQNCLKQKPAVWAWLTRVAGLRPFSVRTYITSKLLDWMRGQNGQHLVEATRFIGKHLKDFEEQSETFRAFQRLHGNRAHRILREKMPWLLADGEVLLPDARAGKELVTPECLEGDTGWNLMFPAINRHFFVINDAYCAGLSEELLREMVDLFKACGATPFPDPLLRELNAGDSHYDGALSRCAHAVLGTPTLRDWAAPGWLLGLRSGEQRVNGKSKIDALERWLIKLGSDDTSKLLYCARQDHAGHWEQISAWSEFGVALLTKAWLRTSKGFVPPTAAYLDTPEFREFFADSVPYVAVDIEVPLLEKLGVRVHLTAQVLIEQLRQMSGSENPDFVLVTKIYRRLQDSTFDADIFSRESLIFLSDPKPRWVSSDKLVWEDAGALFDDDFGYVLLTYKNSELYGFFTEKLNVPVRPELKHYATAWENLWSGATPKREVVERKLKIIFQSLAESQAELAICDWWREMRARMRIWTDGGCFESPAKVYVPDDFSAVETFNGLVPVAYPPKPSTSVMEFLVQIGCRSFAANIQCRLVEVAGESLRRTATYLTPAAKELCILLVCSHRGWQERCSLLEAVLETDEVGVNTLSVEYSLSDNQSAGIRSRKRDAYWDAATQRLLLRDGVDPESLRDAAAESLAAAFFGEAQRVEMQAEFFRLLTVSVPRAKKLMQERTNWRLNPEQQEWLRQQKWQSVITELDEVEQPVPDRTPRTATSQRQAGTSPSPSTTPSSQTAAISGAGIQQIQEDTGEGDVIITPIANGTGSANPGSVTTDHGQEPETKPEGDTPIELHDAKTTSAEVISVRAHSRSRKPRRRGEQTEDTERETTSGLTGASAESKAALEKCGREFAIKELKRMGYEIEVMGQQNPGFDLRAVKPGKILKVEVKSHARETANVFISQREYEEYLKKLGASGETWELWNVENLAKHSMKSPTIQRIGHIPESAMKESGYWVDLHQCSLEPPK
jgi:hypothetical protein